MSIRKISNWSIAYPFWLVFVIWSYPICILIAVVIQESTNIEIVSKRLLTSLRSENSSVSSKIRIYPGIR